MVYTHPVLRAITQLSRHPQVQSVAGLKNSARCLLWKIPLTFMGGGSDKWQMCWTPPKAHYNITAATLSTHFLCGLSECLQPRQCRMHCWQPVSFFYCLFWGLLYCFSDLCQVYVIKAFRKTVVRVVWCLNKISKGWASVAVCNTLNWGRWINATRVGWGDPFLGEWTARGVMCTGQISVVLEISFSHPPSLLFIVFKWDLRPVLCTWIFEFDKSKPAKCRLIHS